MLGTMRVHRDHLLLLPVGVAGALWAGGSLVYYGSTGWGEPQHTGMSLRMRKPVHLLSTE